MYSPCWYPTSYPSYPTSYPTRVDPYPVDPSSFPSYGKVYPSYPTSYPTRVDPYPVDPSSYPSYPISYTSYPSIYPSYSTSHHTRELPAAPAVGTAAVGPSVPGLRGGRQGLDVAARGGGAPRFLPEQSTSAWRSHGGEGAAVWHAWDTHATTRVGACPHPLRGRLIHL